MKPQEKTKVNQLISSALKNSTELLILADYLEEIGEVVKAKAIKYFVQKNIEIKLIFGTTYEIKSPPNKRILDNLIKYSEGYSKDFGMWNHPEDALWAFILAFEEDYNKGFPSYDLQENL